MKYIKSISVYLVYLVIFRAAQCQDMLTKHAEPEEGNMAQFSNIFNLFARCHFKFIPFLDPEISTFSRDIFDTFEKYVVAMKLKVTYSIQTISPTLFKHHRLNSISTTNCLLHVYLYCEKEFPSQHYLISTLQNVIVALATDEDWPHHFILLGHLVRTTTPIEVKSQDLLHSYWLRNSFLRGVVIFFNYLDSKVSLLCFPCYFDNSAVFNHIDLTHFATLPDLREKASELSSNLRRGYAQLQDKQNHHFVTSPCTLHGLYEFFHVKIPLPTRRHCIIHALREKLNFTYTLETDQPFEFSANEHVLISRNNDHFMSTKFTTYYIMSSHLAYFEDLKLFAYQAQEPMSIKILSKPYSTSVWILLGLSITILAVVTIIVERITNTSVQFYPIIIDILSSILDQPVSRNIQKMIRNKGRNMLPVWLRLWMLTAIAITNGYKSVLYSFITKGIPSEWPATISEFALDESFLRLTTNDWSSNHYQQESAVLDSLSYILKHPTTNRDADLTVLHENFKFLPPEMFGKYTTLKNMLAQQPQETINLFGNQYSKLALLDFAERLGSTDILLKTAYPNLLVYSKQIEIENVKLWHLWVLQKNFFAEHFHAALGQLSQSGYLSEINARLFKNKVCNAMMSLLMLSNAPLAEHHLRRCRYISYAGHGPNEIDDGAKPLSWEQLKTIFLLLLQIAPIPVLILCSEILGYKLATNIALNWSTVREARTWGYLVKAIYEMVTSTPHLLCNSVMKGGEKIFRYLHFLIVKFKGN